MKSHSKNAAFTLVEILVVIAIIGVLVSMLLPAVQAVREAARRTDCGNNLRQLGIAVQNYHDTRGSIPPARGADGFLTWPVYLMPELEMGNLQQQFDFGLPYAMQDPQLVRNPIETMFCPTRRNGFRVSVLEQEGVPVGATGDYAGNAGSTKFFNLTQDWSTFEAPTDGVFSSGFAEQNEVVEGRLVRGGVSRYKFRDVTDGLSNTFFIGEKALHIDRLGQNGGWGDNCIYNGDEPFAFMRIGGTNRFLSDTDHGFTLEGSIRSFTGLAPNFGSAHPGVCLFVLGDGSTKAIDDLLDGETLGKLCSRNDGQAIDQEF